MDATETDVGDEGVVEDVSEQVFTDYFCQTRAAQDSPHPAPVSEAASLGAIRLPETDYPLWDSLRVAGSVLKKLSDLQLEGVLYACSKHQELLPNGQRCGFFIGDGAGVGKGRQISAIILDNYIRGRKCRTLCRKGVVLRTWSGVDTRKHLWVSTSPDLYLEAQRDFKDLGLHINIIDGCQELDKQRKKRGLSEYSQEGVLFVTYKALVSVSRGSNRLDQILAWLGEETFEGCMCFDECHKAKNYVPGVASRSTKVAANVLALQNRAPMARVVYCSATGVSDVGHMAYIERLGLWGPSTAFLDFRAFYTCMKRRGISFLEMLAMELKSEGKYIARSLSFKSAPSQTCIAVIGTCRGTEFETVLYNLSDKQAEMYDTAAEFWKRLQRELENAARLTGVSAGTLWKNYWATHQRFFRHLCVAFKVPFVVSLVKEKLEEGFAVVIGLQSTGEAALNSSDLKPGQSCGLISTARVILKNFVQNHFPTTTAKSEEDSEGYLIEECSHMKMALLNAIEELELPGDLLDELIAELGGSEKVAEMTGRQKRLERQSANQYMLQIRSSRAQGLDSVNVSERKAFMSGQKMVAIISDAASTGISLHADRNCANQQRRLHITIELPWSADKVIQQLGRTHRSNQASAPIYQLLCTNVGGEQRFISAVAKRLESLGALTRGDRRAASGASLSESHLDCHYGRISLRKMYEHIVQEKQELPPGVSLASIKDPFNTSTEKSMDNNPTEIFNMHCALRKCLHGVIELVDAVPAKRTRSQLEDLQSNETGKEGTDVRRFLNRLLGQSIQQQSTLFSYFFSTLRAVISTAKTEGLYNEGLSDIKGEKIENSMDPVALYVDPVTNLVTYRNDFIVDRGVSYKEAHLLLQLECTLGDDSGFYRSRSRHFGNYLYMLAIQKTGKKAAFKICRPHTGISHLEMMEDQLHDRYVRVGQDEAETEWIEKYQSSLYTCVHGGGCEKGDQCQIGKRCLKMVVLSGSVVRVWGVLESVLRRHQSKLKKSDSILKIVRVPSKNDGDVIGVKFPEEYLSEVVVALTMMKHDTHETVAPSNGWSTPGTSLRQTATPVDPALLKKITQAPRTLLHYFNKRTSDPPEDLNEELSSSKRRRTLESTSSAVEHEPSINLDRT